MDFVFRGKCRAEKKKEKINTDGTVQDLQVTNLFLDMCGQDAIIKLRSIISPKILIGTPYKDIRLAIQNYISPKKRVVTAERAKFMSVIQGVGESDDNFLERRRDEARYCDFTKLKTASNLEEELVKIMFISGLRDPEAELRLLDGIKSKPTMSITELTESLQFRGQAMVFASSSSGNKPFTGKKKLGSISKRPFKSQMKKLTAKKATIRSLGVEISNTLIDPVQR